MQNNVYIKFPRMVFTMISNTHFLHSLPYIFSLFHLQILYIHQISAFSFTLSFLPAGPIGSTNRLPPAEASGLTLLRLVGCRFTYHQYGGEKRRGKEKDQRKVGKMKQKMC